MVRLPRFTLRGLMVLVVIVALISGGLTLAVRARDYRAQAAYHVHCVQHPPRLIRGNALTDQRTDDPIETERRIQEWVVYHAAMRDKYQKAALSPWLPIEPDPPEPRL
jgi:hypothetical protein